MKPALLVIGMQSGSFSGESTASMTAAAEYIREVAGYFRQAGAPLIWVLHEDAASGTTAGSEACKIIDLLERGREEPLIHKVHANSFRDTDLAGILKKGGVDVVVLTGHAAEKDLLATYRGALDSEILPVMLRHGLASGDPDNLRFVEQICDTVSYRLTGRMLENCSF